MKRHIASRKLKRKCIHCNKEFVKGDVYYRERKIYKDYSFGFGAIIAFESLICPKCRYIVEHHNIRYKKFQMTCIHPRKFIETTWHYIAGECVKEPYYDFCRLCGKILD